MTTSKLGKGQEEKDTPPACTRTSLFFLGCKESQNISPDRRGGQKRNFLCGGQEMSCRAIKRRSDPVAAALTTPPSQTKLCGSQSCWGTPCFAKKIDMERGRDKNAGQESNQEPIECVALTEHHKLPALGGKRRPDEFADVSKHFLGSPGSGQISPLRVRIHNVFTTVITEFVLHAYH